MLLLASAGKKRRENFLSLHRPIIQVKEKLGLPSISSPGKAASERETLVLALP